MDSFAHHLLLSIWHIVGAQAHYWNDYLGCLDHLGEWSLSLCHANWTFEAGLRWIPLSNERSFFYSINNLRWLCLCCKPKLSHDLLFLFITRAPLCLGNQSYCDAFVSCLADRWNLKHWACLKASEVFVTPGCREYGEGLCLSSNSSSLNKRATALVHYMFVNGK